MADALGSFSIGQFSMKPNALAFREFPLLQLELRRKIKQAHLALLLRKHFIQKRQVITEKQH